MEERLDGSYLRAGLFERAAAIGIMSIGIGAAVLLGAWGVSFLWRYTPPEIAVRIANPEVRVAQNGPLIVMQDKPFTIAPPEPLETRWRGAASPTDEDGRGRGDNARSDSVFECESRSGPCRHGLELSGRQRTRTGPPVLLLHGAQTRRIQHKNRRRVRRRPRIQYRGRARPGSRRRSRQMPVVAGMTSCAPG